MKIKINKEFWISIAFFLITISGGTFFSNVLSSGLFLYMGLFILSCITIKRICLEKRNYSKTIFFILSVVLSCFGLIHQNLQFARIMSLVISMIFIFMFAVLDNGIIMSISGIHKIRNGILFGIMTNIITAIIGGYSLFNKVYEMGINIGFNGGMYQKNYYAYTVLTAIFLTIIELKKYNTRKNKCIFWGIMFLLILSVSRGAYILAFIYIAIMNVDVIGRILRKYKIVVIPCAVLFALFIIQYLYINVFQNSTNFMYRVIGLQNYFDYCKKENGRIWYGIAEIAFKDENYTTNIRALTGWNGTTESAILGILVKNGLFGIIVYLLVIINYIFKINRNKGKYNKITFWAIFISAITSILMEGFLIDVKYVFCPVVFILLNSLSSGTFIVDKK